VSSRTSQIGARSRLALHGPRSDRGGFTLIELLVVIAIIATLAAVVAPSLFGNVGEARRSAAKSQLQILSLALDAYRIDNDGYPGSDQGLEALRTIPVGGTPATNWKGPYLKQAVPLDPWNKPYVYLSPGLSNPDGYDLYSLGKDGRPGGSGEDSDITSWGGAVR
jgi:general secretion pathway protein G